MHEGNEKDGKRNKDWNRRSKRNEKGWVEKEIRKKYIKKQ